MLHLCSASTHLPDLKEAPFLALQGSPLYSNYGNKSNEELILGYGFALPENQADFFHVMIGLADKPTSEPGLHPSHLVYRPAVCLC